MTQQNKNVTSEDQGLLQHVRELLQELEREFVRISREVRGTISKASSVSPTARELTFEREAAAFDRMLPELLGTKSGKFVAVRDGQVIDVDDDEFALARRIEQGYRGTFVLIRQVLANQPGGDRLESPEWETL